ncbi:MAG: mevalonate kinase [Marinilabiliales bacterium]|jgi:mevalonate kinase|nr:MAG: mevalonate kinase [Marinilabiliales bacterium]
MNDFHDFYSKILLFGEYSVICNSMGLTIPYQKYSGNLQKIDEPGEEARKSSENLKGFYAYLLQLSAQKELSVKLDLDAFKNDLERNLYFDSNIPQGYGVGSSGAICAAIYDAYAIDKITDPENICLPELKQIFALMESYFHGVSSGLDPLNSYLKKTLLIHDKETLEIIETPSGFKKNELATFLVDTNLSGETEHLVNIFFDKCRYYKFYKEVKNELIPMNNLCIELFMKGNLSGFLAAVEKLSLFFFKHFKPMIPETFVELWEKGIHDKKYSLKLCGSGGGGFLLGFTTDFEASRKEFDGYTLQKLEM